MKILIRVALAGAGLLLVLVVLAALVLPRLVASDAARGQIESAARSALGREVRLGELDVGLLPPSLLVASPRIAGASPDAEPLLEAREVALRIALLPLLTGTVVVDSLRVDGATLHLVRTGDGIELPTGPDEADTESAPAGDAAPVTLAVREVVLSNASLVLDDRALTPPARTRLAVDVRISGSAMDAPLAVVATLGVGEAGADGSLRASGSATLGGALDLELTLADLALAAAAPYAGEGVEALDGRLSGDVRVTGPGTNPSMTLALELAATDVRAAGASVTGPIRLQAELSDVVERLAGPFEMDASAAHVRYGEALDKAPGRRLRVTGTLAPGAEPGAPELRALRVELANLEATGQVQLAPAARAELETNRVDVAGWEQLLPPLRDAAPQGALQVESLRVATQPMSLDGRVRLEDLRVELPDRGPVALSGALRFQGDTLVSEELVASAAEQPFGVEVRVEDLFGTPRYEGTLSTEAADVNALATAFASTPDTLFGPLDLVARFDGRLEPEVPPLETLRARLEFDIERGRIVGDSILESAMGELGGTALAAGSFFAGPEIQRFYGDEFDLMVGDLRLEGGRGRSRPLRIEYRDYGVELVGDIDLADLSLDMKGSITFYEAIDTLLAARAGAPEDYRPRRRELVLAKVRGTLAEPKVKLAGGGAARFAGQYARDLYGEDLRRQIDDQLGPGAGQAVEDALEGLFGGGRRRDKPRDEPREAPANEP